VDKKVDEGFSWYQIRVSFFLIMIEFDHFSGEDFWKKKLCIKKVHVSLILNCLCHLYIYSENTIKPFYYIQVKIRINII